MVATSLVAFMSFLWQGLGDAPSTSAVEGLWSGWSELCGVSVVEAHLLLRSCGRCSPGLAFGSASSLSRHSCCTFFLTLALFRCLGTLLQHSPTMRRLVNLIGGC